MSGSYHPPQQLLPGHTVDTFECRSPEQTEWLRRHARQSHAGGLSKVLVVTHTTAEDVVVAYYAWAMASIAVDDAPTRILKGAGRYPQPVALLARLGVDTRHERQGIGAGLLQDVFKRVTELGASIGCRGLLIHAENKEARDFYLHLIPEFLESPTDPLHLVLLMKDIHHTLGR